MAGDRIRHIRRRFYRRHADAERQTGQFEVYDINNNQITSAAGMGQVGTQWVPSGPSNLAGVTTAQITQAMAAFAPAGGTVPISQQIDQPSVQASTASLLRPRPAIKDREPEWPIISGRRVWQRMASIAGACGGRVRRPRCRPASGPDDRAFAICDAVRPSPAP